jgi:hypothetical protein
MARASAAVSCLPERLIHDFWFLFPRSIHCGIAASEKAKTQRGKSSAYSEPEKSLRHQRHGAFALMLRIS